MKIPVLSFVGRSNTGKTTLIERLIPLLKSRGIRVATIKHHHHDFEIDLEGKDSYRHKKAGARLAMIASPKKIALVEDIEGELGLEELLSRYARDVDLVIAEGYKEEEHVPRIEIYDSSRDASPLSQGHEGLLALISDLPLEAPVPVFRRDEIQRFSQLIVEKLNL